MKQKNHSDSDRLRSLIENLNEIIYEYDQNGVVTYVSPAVEKISGLKCSDFVGHYYDELIIDENYSLQERLTQLREKKTLSTERKFRLKDGSIRWTHTSTKAIYKDDVFCGGIGVLIDFTDRKLAEIELKSSEEKYRKSEVLYHSILDESPDDITVTSLDGIIEIVSLSGIKLFGYDNADEIIGRSMYEFVDSGKNQNTLVVLEKILHKELNETIEMIGVKKDGTRFPMEVSASFIPDKKGNPDKIIINVRDITAKKKAEYALIESESSLNYAQEIAGLGSWEFFLETKKLIASKNFYNLYNLEPKSDSRELLRDIMRTVYDKEMFKSEILNSFEENKTEKYEIKSILPGGYIKWFRVFISPVFKEGILTSLKGVNIDITEQKQKDDEIRKLSLAVSQSPVAVIITNPDAVIEFVNPEFERMTGYKSSFIYGKNASILKSGKTPRTIYDRLWVNLSNGRPFETEWLNKKANGNLYWEHIIITPIVDENGNATNYLAVKTDISERKKQESDILNMNEILDKKVKVRTAELLKANEEIRMAREIAVKANKAKSEFLSRMSHELRTPLNAILGYSQLLEISELGASQIKGVKSIIQSGNHLLDLINEVLDISIIENGKVEYSLEPVQVNPVLQEAINLVLPMTKKNDISLNFNDILIRNDVLLTDRQRLKQIFINILANAIKYNKPLGTVTGRAYEVEDKTTSKPFLRIEISDTGIGISKENIEKLFHPFERIGSDLSGIEGTGLGLTVVQKLIEVLGGKIGVESTPDLGSMFWFELPVDKSEILVTQQNDDVEDNKTNNMTEINTETGKILYIEDNLSNVELIEQILELQFPNVKFHAIPEGDKALETALKVNPDVIFLDLNLPGMHGSEVLKLLKNNPETLHIPVIIISADAMYDKTKELFRAGAYKFLTKPFRLNEFLTILNEFF